MSIKEILSKVKSMLPTIKGIWRNYKVLWNNLKANMVDKWLFLIIVTIFTVWCFTDINATPVLSIFALYILYTVFRIEDLRRILKSKK